MKDLLWGILGSILLVFVLVKVGSVSIGPLLPSQVIGEVGVEPELPPDINDWSVWKSGERVCIVAPEQQIKLTEYAKEINGQQILSIGVLSLGDIRMAIRAGVYAMTHGRMVEVVHVRQTNRSQWVRFDWTDPKEQDVAKVQALSALQVTGEQFDKCFRGQ